MVNTVNGYYTLVLQIKKVILIIMILIMDMLKLAMGLQKQPTTEDI